MNSTREHILQTLLEHPRATVSDLAGVVGINVISVRHHLDSLKADGLITVEEERHGVGRPRLRYTLTDQGREHFPTHYLRLTNRLLEQIKETLPEPVVARLFATLAGDIAGQHAARFAKMAFEERLEGLKKILAEEGFVISWERDGESYRIHEIVCPYYRIGQQHPEICLLDQTLISRLLAVPIEKIQCVLHGGEHCTYLIQRNEKIEESA
ncbi:MAG TPA: winged helix-turn-helix transcriptional regulator [Anaerolineaceae bacterium]|jgi:predicted ArsR family transcriptional regulator|nr:winged helix-turn-helix transcriptional regulator [Anaerolineaceae bacterium]